jgi:hypothetical protein
MSEFKQNQCWVGFCWKKYNKEETGHPDERSLPAGGQASLLRDDNDLKRTK